MKHFFSENKYFLIPYLLFFIGFATAIIFTDKASLHLWLNGFHTPLLDVFFKYITKVGEWIPYLVVAVLLFYKLGTSIFVLIGQLASGLVTQILKYFINAPRPKLFFAENFSLDVLPMVNGVHLHSNYSFPSGHTTAIFALFISIALLTKNKMLKCLYLILAVLSAYSRIYLSQHFPIDVLIGSFIGVSVVSALWIWRSPKRPAWADLSVQQLLRNHKKAL